MGLSWQQGPLGRNPNGQFLVPERPGSNSRTAASLSTTVRPPSSARRRRRSRIDIRCTSRHLVVRAHGRVVAETTSPLVLYESGFAPRWYVPRQDVAADALMANDAQTFCPYKGIASYYDIDDSALVAAS